MNERGHNDGEAARPPLKWAIRALVAALSAAGLGLCVWVNGTLDGLHHERAPGSPQVEVAVLPARPDAPADTAAVVVGGARDAAFVPLAGAGEPVLPPTADGRWYRFDFHNTAPAGQRGVLDLDWRFLDRAVLHVTGPDGVARRSETGESVTWGNRPRPSPLLVFDVELPPESRTRAYLLMTDHHRAPERFVWWPDVRNFDRLERFVLVQWSAFGGLWVGLLAYNVFLFAVLRRRDSARYVVYAVSLGLLIFLGSNLSTLAFPWPGWPLREMLLGLLLPWTTLALGRFSRSFLDTALVAPELDRRLARHRWPLLATVLALPLAWQPPPAGRAYLACVFLVNGVLVLDLVLAGVSRWRRGDALAKLFVVAFLPSVVGSGWALLAHRQVVIHDRMSGLPMLAGHGLELIFLSLAIAQRHRRAVDDRRRLEANYARQLEEEVSARTAEMRTAGERLEEALREKDRVLAIIGHDLRGPTLALKSLAGLLSDDPKDMTPDELADLAGRMGRASDAQLELLDNLLMWGRAQTGDWRPRADNRSVAEGMAAAVALLEPVATAKGIVWGGAVSPEAVVHVDRQVFATLLRNLLGNAVKFSPAGGRVTVEAVRHTDAVEIRIGDTGAGIDPARLAQVFSGRIESTRGTAGEKGTGIGLNLCRDLARASGGGLTLESAPGGGTVAVLVLPAGT